MKIQIVNVDLVDKTGPSGKPYQLVEVTYKNLTFQGKVEMKPVMPFGVTAETAEVLKTATKGDLFTITKVKNDKGFIDWTAAAPEAAPAPGKNLPASSYAAPATSSTQATKSTYETPEERAKKQVYIVRQSSITAALTFLNNNMQSSTSTELVSTDAVLAVAKEFENYVFGIETVKPTSFDSDAEDDLPE